MIVLRRYLKLLIAPGPLLSMNAVTQSNVIIMGRSFLIVIP